MQRHALRIACLIVLGMSPAMQIGAAEPPPVVDHVDLRRYLGDWYEIKKIPNRFQDQCTGNTTASYSTRSDGRLNVINRCLTQDGSWDQAEGIARITDPVSNAKLEVSFVRLFGWQLFWGDYWIIELANDYSYAIVGHPHRRYGWVLSRTPTLSIDPDPRLRELGYDPADFEATRQGLAPGRP